jgi:hypothetical protein
MDSQQMTDALEFHPNVFVSEEEREEHLLALYPPYIPLSRIPQPVEAEPEEESSHVIEAAPEIASPPIATEQPIAQEPKRHPALANVYSWVTNPLSGPK